MTIGLTEACAARLQHAKYAGWEPIPAEIPALHDAAQAKLRLRQSRELWQVWRDRQSPDPRETGRVRTWDAAGYSYLRAQQLSEKAVDFTLFVVKRDRVVLRALVE